MTLLILAAGMGSRYGGLKQMDPVGPAGEAIIDYSIYDAIKAGFDKVVFVIRKDFEEAFRAKFDAKLEGKIEVAYAFQSVDAPIEGIDKMPERVKPWGTGHAVLVAADVINEPFAVINADDYYGLPGFKIMANFLKNDCSASQYSMVGYELNNTLSDNGTVSRGICDMDDAHNLTGAREHTKICWKADNIEALDENDKSVMLNPKALVSMNFWGLHHSVFGELKQMFKTFVENNSDKPKAEFYIPYAINDLIHDEKVAAKVLANDGKWHGVTYREDAPTVQTAFTQMTESGMYPTPLWA
ncbi:MAG: UTP-glucose-1-phosphate uridylyltransferase [Paraglaciecola sp.]|jgi:UTP-glucose-1-phosphate uridylyltransferase